jgi:MYXO-CTERM domain-containing protein
VKRSFITVLPAVAATLVAGESSANPPPPKVLPDPPVSAPTKEEAPNVIRKHEGICFAFYPAGGTLPVACPTELVVEPIGEAIIKNSAGRCQYIPFQAGGPGRTGNLDKCPVAFEQLAKSGVIPDESIKLMQQALAARKSDEVPAMDPPLPARLETTPPQQVGCGGCATSRTHGGTAALTASTLLLVATRRRRRR